MIVFSIGAVWHYFQNPAVALAVGVLVGGVLQFLVQVPLLVRQGMTFNFGVSFRHTGVRAVGRLMLPGFIGIGIAQINFLVDTIFLTSARMQQHVGTGALTAHYVADRVMELVLGGYAIAVATAILPMMAHQAAARDFDSLKKTFAFSLRIVSYITVPAMVGLVVLREPIIHVLFEHGRFVAASTRLTARALLYYSLGLPALAAVKLIVPAFYATQDTRTPVRIAVYSFILNIVLNVLFQGIFYFLAKFQNGGPALATSIAAYFNFLMLIVIFRLRYGRLGSVDLLLSLGKILASSGMMGAACWIGLRYSHFSSHPHFATQLLIFLGLLAGATVLYIGLTWVMRCPEVEEVYGIAIRGEAGAAAMLE
jgi:putative peptidoglycan lipid II flippase